MERGLNIDHAISFTTHIRGYQQLRSESTLEPDMRTSVYFLYFIVYEHDVEGHWMWFDFCNSFCKLTNYKYFCR